MKQLVIDNLHFSVSMPKRVRKRHKTTAFRANDIRRAGNFTLWESWRELLADELIGNAFLECVYDLMRTNYRPREKLSIKHPIKKVGWAVSVPLSYNYREDRKIKVAQLNKKTTILQVDDARMLAPLTDIVTFVFRMEVSSKVQVIMEKVFPGYDHGPLTGDLRKSGRLFFRPEHPGGSQEIDEEI